MAGKKAKAKARKAAATGKDAGSEMGASLTYEKPYNVAGAQFENFELKIAGEKGLGAFATKDIKAGTVILYETPLFIIDKPLRNITTEDVTAAYNVLSPTDKRIFNNMRHTPGYPDSYKLAYFTANNFNVGNAWSAYGCFPICSRFNHSCQPNVSICQANDRHKTTNEYQREVTANTDIKAGTELTFVYTGYLLYMPTEQRKHVTKMHHLRFTCACTLCSLPPPDREVSDLRRNIMRHLLFWIEKKDMDQTPLPVQAEKRELDWMDGAFYILLFIQLAEAEQLHSVSDNHIWWSYSDLMTKIMQKARKLRKKELECSTVQNMRYWWERMQFACRDGEWLDEGTLKMHTSVGAMVKMLEDDGTIHWDALPSTLLVALGA